MIEYMIKIQCFVLPKSANSHVPLHRLQSGGGDKNKVSKVEDDIAS